MRGIMPHIRLIAPIAVGITLSFATAASAETLAHAESQGQSTLDAYVASTVPGTPEASQIESQQAGDPMIRQALLDNAIQTDVVTGDPPAAGPPLSASATSFAPMYANRYHNAVSSTHYWKDPLLQINLAWVRATELGWYYNGSYITGVSGWNLQGNSWTGTGYCSRNESYSHNGYGATNAYGNTAWAHGYHRITVGPWFPVIGCGLTGQTATASLRIAGNGYWDKLY